MMQQTEVKPGFDTSQLSRTPLSIPLYTSHVSTYNFEGDLVKRCPAITCGVGATKGKRKAMEDRHGTQQDHTPVHIFAVIDGHGGYETAEFLKETLSRILLDRNLPPDTARDKRAFHEDTLKRSMYIRNELSLRTRDIADVSGAVMCFILLTPTGGDVKFDMDEASDDEIIAYVSTFGYDACVVNIGDCRCLLRRRNDKVLTRITRDHTCKNKDERARIEVSIEQGAAVEIENDRLSIQTYHTEANKTMRTTRSIEPTRTFGDPMIRATTRVIDPIPEFFYVDNVKYGDLLVLHTDGINDSENVTLNDLIPSVFTPVGVEQSISKIIHAYEPLTKDNVTCMLIYVDEFIVQPQDGCTTQ
jgi:serine/threonine protein phosphatase PrpC